MNAVLCAMIFSGALYGALRGELAEVSRAALTGGEEALQMVLRLTGAFLLFGGAMRVLEAAGVTRGMVRLLRRPLHWLFSDPLEEDTLAAVTENLAANMLGLSNAATPMGIRAAKAMNRAKSALPSASLCLFLVINATSVQLIPTSVVALRQAAGSAAPECILLPSLIASGASTCVGVLICKLLEGRRKA